MESGQPLLRGWSKDNRVGDVDVLGIRGWNVRRKMVGAGNGRGPDGRCWKGVTGDKPIAAGSYGLVNEGKGVKQGKGTHHVNRGVG